MRIECVHGYFKFEEQRAGELSEFVSLFGLELDRAGDHFTFADLVDAPDYSIKDQPYLNATATITYAGRPWEIFEANGFVYDFDSGLVEPIEEIVQRVQIFQAGTFFVSPGLILPGSLTAEGDRVKDYVAWFSKETMRFRYSEVAYV